MFRGTFSFHSLRPAQSAAAGSQIGRHILNLAGTFDQNKSWVSPLRMRLKETSKFKRDLIIEYGVRVQKHRVTTIAIIKFAS